MNSCCVSMLTLLPDYLYRRYAQGRRIGHEITIFSVWYELRWGITLCLILTVLLITIVLYNHPASSNVNSLFRPFQYFPRWAAGYRRSILAITTRLKRAIASSRWTRRDRKPRSRPPRVAEVDASMLTAKADILSSEGKLQEAQGALDQVSTNYGPRRNCSSVTPTLSPHGRSRSFRRW